MPELSQNSTLWIDRNQIGSDRKIMLFNLATDGHHPGYIQHLINFWGERGGPGCLDVVVSPKFMQRHTDIVNLASKYGQDRVNFVPISVAEETAFFPQSSYLNRKIYFFQEWKLCRKYAKALNATHCLLMYFDTLQIPIAFGGKSPCSFSAIYFRPTFHYDDFEHYKPTWKDRLQQSYEKFLLSLVLRHRQLKTLLCLDPFVLKHLNQFNTAANMVYLPDPVEIYNNTSTMPPEKLRHSLGVEADRKVLLLFGGLNQRKGLHQLLEAVSLLPSNVCQKLCLLLVGPIDSGIESQVRAKIAHLSQSLPVQIITCNQFVVDRDIQTYFQLADVILAPYQRHVGMSAILVRAAAAQKPVLSSDYGLMGEITRRHQLGLTVDSTVPNEIARGLTEFLLETPEKFCDRNKMKLLAEQNTVEQFASTIFSYM
ncbi:glycosyl transferase family 1 [Scytonema hofmannii PCC 7110]|uniref:Glycosyl transferase family 1 n=1 Tax=Scytonema hofmannii PCC 7110 TaxID=128403 RepID=A0A139XA49_9CYAN|nr:glycosyltransferase family 4 protein [Scytonema hofmannii]KYC41559.1 glycosyl transferase family 1 [Scytonema hofmannii PCC 7110]